MQQVFLIHAHKDIEGLNRLVEQLVDPDFLVYVHLDRSSALDPAALHRAARLVTPRLAVRWGGISQVTACLASLRQILADIPHFDKVTFLSAQDFPLLSNSHLKQQLARLRGRELIELGAIARDAWPVMARYQYFHRTGGTRPERVACRIVNGVLRVLHRTRRFPAGFRPYGGSCWWSLSRACLVELLRLSDLDPRLLRFCRWVQCPDELFFQTMIMHSRFAPRVLPDNFRYIQWPNGGARNPKVLGEGDFAQISASHAHFCRKLDSRDSAALVKRLVAWKEGRAA